MTILIPLRNALKRLPANFLTKDTIPLIGYPPPFPWDEFSSFISKQLQLENLHITPANASEWKESKDFYKGFGDQTHTLSLQIMPGGGALYVIMASEDLLALMGLLLTKNFEPITVEKNLEQSFFRFLANESLQALGQINFDKNLSAHIQQHSDLPEEACLSLDVSVSIQDKTFWTRLIMSPQLQQQWKERYQHRTVLAPLAADLDLIIHLVVGKSSLTFNEWSQIKLGDFFFLDSCSITPNGEGDVQLSLDGSPLYRGKLKNGNIKILESPLYQEVGLDMSANDNSKNLPENDLPENDLPENDQIENDQIENEEEEEVTEEDFEATYDQEIEEEFAQEELAGPATPQEVWPPPPEKRPETPAKKEKKELEKPKFSAEEIPIPVVIEVGRIQMSVQKLMELQPGNLLELDVKPENGVDIVVNGKRIAKGELILIGEALGVRVIDI